MKKQKRNNANGITLIALVISIIVMLILAGVSINALVGDNGVLTQTQYASFLNEMSAVEEAVGLWKAGKTIEARGEESNAIPTRGMCSATTLQSTERLVGEVGYYRMWSIVGTKPATDVLTSSSTFNSNFESELIFYPAGVQDLYYLNNEEIGIKGDKVYLIDASTGMVFSMAGIGLKGIRCYSSSMAKAVMNGDNSMPLFAAAEVTGSGSGEALAGNISAEYLEDGTLNPNYNPYGFEIIADCSNPNIYKLYNNGDLYGKGVKGVLLNTDPKELESINPYVWNKLTIPSEIPGYNTNEIQVVQGYSVIYVIDKNNDLWAWGNNNSNRLGLTQDEQIEYTGRTPVKINVNGKKVKKVMPCGSATFVLTIDNELYASGDNGDGQLGTGESISSSEKFKIVEFEHPENITQISFAGRCYIIMCGSGVNRKIYYAGSSTYYGYQSSLFSGTEYAGNNVTKFVELGNGIGATPPVEIVSYTDVKYESIPMICIGIDGNAYWYNFCSYSKVDFDSNNGTVTDIKAHGSIIVRRVLENGDVQFWGYSVYSGTDTCVKFLGTYGTFVEINSLFPVGYTGNDIKDFIYDGGSSLIFLTNSGKLFGSGYKYCLGINTADSIPSTEFIEIDTINNIKNFKVQSTSTGASLILEDNSNNWYMTNYSNIIFGNSILQGSWTKIASNVKKFHASTSSNCIAYIDKNDDIWVAGDDSYMLGINTENVESVPQFVLLKEKIKDVPAEVEGEKTIYEHIDGNVKDYYFASKCFWILTDEDDNNTLYACGHYLSYDWSVYSYIGTGLSENCKIPTKLKDNILCINMYGLNRFAVTKNNELYTWGRNDGSSLGRSGSLDLQLNTGIDYSKITKIVASTYQSYYIKNEDTKNALYVTGCGIGHSSACNGWGNTVSTWTKFDPSVFNNEELVDIARGNGKQNYIVLTETGKLYGWGVQSSLGIGTSSTDLQKTAIPLSEINSKNLDFTQITAGPGWFIAVTRDGKVYGTGTNIYGVLGRWSGSPRGVRYRTAFSWVECPELEI